MPLPSFRCCDVHFYALLLYSGCAIPTRSPARSLPEASLLHFRCVALQATWDNYGLIDRIWVLCAYARTQANTTHKGTIEEQMCARLLLVPLGGKREVTKSRPRISNNAPVFGMSMMTAQNTHCLRATGWHSPNAQKESPWAGWENAEKH